MDIAPALFNAIDMLPKSGGFISDLDRTTNSAEPASGATWLLAFVASYLQRNGQPHGYIAAFDHAIWDIEAIDQFWPAARIAVDDLTTDGVQVADDTLPAVARFLVERLPSLWDGSGWYWHETVTQAVQIADCLHDLIGLFAVGIRPTGSKDPQASRRAARALLMQILPPTHEAFKRRAA